MQETRSLHSYLIFDFNRHQTAAPVVLISEMDETMWLKTSEIIQLKGKKCLKPSSWSLMITGNRKAQVILKLAGLDSTCNKVVSSLSVFAGFQADFPYLSRETLNILIELRWSESGHNFTSQ